MKVQTTAAVTDVVKGMRRGDIYQLSEDITVVKGPGANEFVVRAPRAGLDSTLFLEDRRILVEGTLGFRVDNPMGKQPGRKEAIIQ